MLISRQLPVRPERAYVLGSGKFGSSAVFKINRRWPNCEIHVVDRMAELSSNLPGLLHAHTEAVQFLRDNLHSSRPDELVIPCIPEHLAFNWVHSHIGFPTPVPVRLMECLPGAIAGKDGCIYCSLSDFVCTSSCTEPEGYCPITEKEREEPLFETFDQISLNSYKVIVVRSAQLLPGVGAFTSDQLFALLAYLRKEKGRFLIGTASRCHGVINGFVH